MEANTTIEREIPARSDSGQIRTGDSRVRFRQAGPPGFTIVASDSSRMERFLHGDAYSAAVAFVRGEIDIEGDLVAAIRWKAAQPQPALMSWCWTLAAKARRLWLSGRREAPSNIQFHYDRSNTFYETFLDSRMVYSCAYFDNPAASLDEAQRAKLEHICRKLDIRPDERFLDIGCGWGGLLIHAAENYGSLCEGCTLSRSQAEYIRASLARRGLDKRVQVREADFQTLRGRFDKIASVGMFEHLGHNRLRGYFRHIAGIVGEEGLFLNHGITRPQRVKDGPETYFLQKEIFPGGELMHVSEVCRSAEEAGFEVLDAENLRPHYALTCRAWVNRLRRNAERCMQLVGEETYRAWLLYIAGSAASFEDGSTDIYQILMARRSRSQRRHLTRKYMYA